TQKAPMPTARGQLGSAAGPDGLIYAVGGVEAETCGDPLNTTTVEAYNPIGNAWSAVPSMLEGRDTLASSLEQIKGYMQLPARMRATNAPPATRASLTASMLIRSLPISG